MKNVLPILLLFLGHISSPASYLTPEQSLKRLAELMDTDCDTLEKTDIKKHYIATINDKDGQPAIYVFTYSGDQGFMLLSADDVSLPLLA